MQVDARRWIRWALLCGLVAWSGAAASGGESPVPADSRKVVIPFDFVSRFDKGRYGEMVGEMIWKKLTRETGFIVPETMLDVRDTCKTNNIKIGPDTPLSEVKRYVTDDFGAQIGIWGSVELAPGHDGEVYDLVIKCVDFSTGSEPRVIYEVSARTNSVSEIPHKYVKEMLDKLYDRVEGAPPKPDAIAEEFWRKNPNLVIGDFEQGGRGVPKGWEATGGQDRQPLGGIVAWAAEAGNPGNKVIRFTLDKGLAEGTGVLYYSDLFPIEAGAKYRFQCRYRTNGPSPKVFIKCYDEIGTEYRTGSNVTSPAKTKKDYIPEEKQLREVYRSQQNLKGAANQWQVQTEDFTPKHTKYVPRWGRVMLYAYLHPGVVEWDDVVVKQILPASPGELPSEDQKKHSIGTKVTIKEMEENQRRSEELKSQQRNRQAPPKR